MTDFQDPGTGGGDKLPLEDLNGTLLLITVHDVVHDIETKFGTSDAIRADVAALDGTRKGETYVDTLIFPRLLQGQLRSSVGSKVLGRLGQGANKKGNPPWQLTPATEAEKDIGRRYIAHMATQQPVTVPDDEPPF